MPISYVQQGVIVQQEFAKLLMIGSGGLVELAEPVTDDERRDYEIHVKGRYGFGLALQIKSTRRLQYMSRLKTPYLHCQFDVVASRVVDNPYYWYLIAYLDLKLMRFADPVFLVPSTFFHENASPDRKGDMATFVMTASMKPESNDKWSPYRVSTLDLGKKVLQLMSDLEKHQKRDKKLQLPPPLTRTDPDILWLRKAA